MDPVRVKPRWRQLGICALGLSMAASVAAAPPGAIERGRYLVLIGGCNDCHTPGFGESGGKTPEKDWLVGSPLGWQGPWGTTYAANLRLYFNKATLAQWRHDAAAAKYRPPMPGFTLQRMRPRDLADIYHFIHSLGSAGEPAPAYVPPGGPVSGPVVRFP